MAETMPVESDVVRAQGGDDAAFERIVAPYRRELHAHCYRMLGSTHDADDVLQDTLVKAWRGLHAFEGRSSLRTWLYTVATRTCLDASRARGRRALPVDLGPASPTTVLVDVPRTDVAWLEPWPAAAGPEGHLEQREAVELAFVAAVQHLPGNQRAALLLFDVLGFTAAEIATMMQTSTASVNSALQRARAVVAARVPSGTAPAAADDVRARELAAAFASALERGDTDGLVALLTHDVTWAMPPLPGWYAGLAAVTDFALRVPLGDCGRWRSQPMSANGGPAFALWLQPPGGTAFDAWSINLLDTRDGRVAGVTSFIGAEQFPRFGLPTTLT